MTARIAEEYNLNDYFLNGFIGHTYLEDLVEKIQNEDKLQDSFPIELIVAGAYFISTGSHLRKFEEKSEEEKEIAAYEYIPYSRTGFVKLVKVVKNKFKPKHFIDIGCGIGDKVLLAYLFGDFDQFLE
jgi:hypothetical protein